jgi:TonB family protein
MNHTVAGLASVFMYPGTLLGTFQDAKGIYYPIKTGKAYYQITNEADYLRDLPEFLTEAPLAVLVSQQTKGAPEILAFNLLDGRNAILLGEEFEGGVGNSIDLHNPFYHLIAPILSIAPIEAEQSQPQSKRYIYQEIQIAGKDNCTEEQYSYLTNKSSEALVKVVKYPRSAQIKEIEGAGSLATQVDKTGKLVSQWILISTGDDALDYAMLEAGQKAKFPSAECISETATYRIPIVFLLTN